jgi:transcription elongation factor GreA
LTRQSLSKLQDRLAQLSQQRADIVTQGQQAYENDGQWHDNFAWEDADRQRARVDGEIKELKAVLGYCELLERRDISGHVVEPGVVVRIATPTGEREYSLLGPYDLDPDQGVISYQCPLAQAMMGRRAGRSFKFREDLYKVLAIRPWEGGGEMGLG